MSKAPRTRCKFEFSCRLRNFERPSENTRFGSPFFPVPKHAARLWKNVVYQLCPTHHPLAGSPNALTNRKLSLSPTVKVKATSRRLLSLDVMSLLFAHCARPEKVPRGGCGWAGNELFFRGVSWRPHPVISLLTLWFPEEPGLMIKVCFSFFFFSLNV